VSRVICSDSQTLKDLTGKQTSCAPYKCIADACRTQCGSVDDCADGFVCDYGGRCVQAPGGDSSGCAVSGAPSSGGAILAGAVWMLAAFVARRRRRGLTAPT
jgi:MYXO-CTERM domain-containing protein